MNSDNSPAVKKSQEFPLSTILAVSTGTVGVAPSQKKLFDLLRFMVGIDLKATDCERAINELLDPCKQAILKQYPMLDRRKADMEEETDALEKLYGATTHNDLLQKKVLRAWADELSKKLGVTHLKVVPLSREQRDQLESDLAVIGIKT